MHVGDKQRIIRDSSDSRGWWCLSGPEAGSLLIQVALDHCGGMRLMLADLFRGQPRPVGEVASINGFAPGRDAWGEHGRMHESDAIGNGISGDDGVGIAGAGCHRDLGLGCERRRRRRKAMRKVQTPKPSDRGTRARQDKVAVFLDGDSSGGERCGAAVIAQETDGDEGTGFHLRKNVGFAGSSREKRDVQGCDVTGTHGAAIWQEDRDAGIRLPFVCERGGAGEEVASASCVGNDRRWLGTESGLGHSRLVGSIRDRALGKGNLGLGTWSRTRLHRDLDQCWACA